MRNKLSRLTVFAGSLALVLLPALARAQPANGEPGDAERQRIEKSLEELRAMKSDLARTMRDFDKRIKKLESAMARTPAAPAPTNHKPAPAAPAAEPATVAEAADTQSQSRTVAANPPPVPSVPASGPADKPDDSGFLGSWGTYQPGRGFVLVRGSYGEISASLIAYARYLNQLGLDKTYTDSFGRTFPIHLRQDVQWNKVNLSFRGWLFDPNFTYRVWIWTQQPAMGEGAQVVVGGQLGYHFADYLNVYAGIAPLPSTRSTNWTYPFWLKMDNRTFADEFFRASYSQGVWADGTITDGLEYRVMIANNLSALGIAASQLDAEFNTMSGAITWMPTTGEFGPAEGFGDFEGHEDVATLFALHYTRSREDKQQQPSVDDIENTQIRLADGTRIFAFNAFNTGGQINKATYQMFDAEAGVKYLGFSLEAEFYWRWVNDFNVTGFIPVHHLYDTGYQVQASAMILPRQLQIYAAGSQIFGAPYGDPWDVTVGLNWYPFDRREMHINTQAIYNSHSPVGGLSYPYVVGGNGWLFNTDVIVSF